MMQTVTDASFQTTIFAVILGLVFLFSLRRRSEPLGFSHDVTNQLKGFAVLTILFGHIGYFLFTDRSFLVPLSNISGVGVDIFFLLSGFGLAISALKKNYKPLEFYRRRVGKIFVPLWVVLVILLILDAILLRQFYDWPTVIRSFFGLFPSADIYKDINSPLWYLTPLLFYYLIFPWLFKPRWAIFSALVMLLIGIGMLALPLPITDGVHNLYNLHFIAFPLGVFFAACMHGLEDRARKMAEWMRAKKILKGARYIFLITLFLIFVYSANAGGEGLYAQIMSIICATSVLLVFVCIKLRFRMFEVLGNYSYEIYLLHWPLLYRFDFIYHFVPAGFGTSLYLLYFIGLAYLLRRICGKV